MTGTPGTRRLVGRVALLTGAAGGIGQATAVRFAEEGAQLVLTDVAAAGLDEVAALAEKAGAEVLTLTADVTRTVDWERIVTAARDRFGGLDILFNNAGIEGVVKPIEDYPEEMFDRVLAVNVRGVFLGMKHAVPALRARGGGVIINTSSVAGLVGNPLVCAYIASKHAVLGLTKSAGIGWGGEGIRVNAVCPSPIETRMMRSLEAGFDPDDAGRVKSEMESLIPVGRYGTPEEVAALVAFLCSDEARFINGAIYTIDGGMTAS